MISMRARVTRLKIFLDSRKMDDVYVTHRFDTVVTDCYVS
jgi:hypothetical protein